MDINVLKDHLTEETFAQVTTELQGKDLKLADLSQGGYVSKSKYDTAVADAANHKADADKWKGDYDAIKGEYDTFKTSTEGEKATAEKQLIKAMVETGLVKAKASDIEVVMPLIDTDKITRNDNGLEGLAEQLDSLKQAKAYLFETEGPAAPNKGKTGLDHGGDDGLAEENHIRKVMGLPTK
jgi:hypothetical protein